MARASLIALWRLSSMSRALLILFLRLSSRVLPSSRHHQIRLGCALVFRTFSSLFPERRHSNSYIACEVPPLYVSGYPKSVRGQCESCMIEMKPKPFFPTGLNSPSNAPYSLRCYYNVGARFCRPCRKRTMDNKLSSH